MLLESSTRAMISVLSFLLSFSLLFSSFLFFSFLFFFFFYCFFLIWGPFLVQPKANQYHLLILVIGKE